MSANSATGPAKALYGKYETTRAPFLDRARDAATLTIPTLIPPDNNNSQTKYPTPYQGLGARGVNNLASKLLLALFPPNSPFFRLSLDDFTLAELTQQEGMRAEVEEQLNKIERAVMNAIEGSSIRVSAFEALKHLIVAGNTLIYLPPEGGIKVYPLNRYTVKRDPMGNLLRIITVEYTNPLALKKEVREACDVDDNKDKAEDTVEIYTHVQRSDDGTEWKINQELNGNVIPGSEGTYPLDRIPWIPLRLIKIDNEDYGRGYVEEIIGDLTSLEGLTKAIVQGSAAAAKVLFMVAPNGTTSAKTLDKSPNGAIVEGNAGDVSTLQLGKFNDFRVALETIQIINERMAYAFLLHSAVQRNAERVTATEVLKMSQELDDALGGIYSILSLELQLPLVKVIMRNMERGGKLPVLPEGVVQPQITTGLEALGRGHDLQKLQALVGIISPLGPEVISTYLNVGDFIKRAGTSLAIDMDGLVATEEQVAAAQQQAQMMSMMEKLGPNVVNQFGGLAKEQTKNAKEEKPKQ